MRTGDIKHLDDSIAMDKVSLNTNFYVSDWARSVYFASNIWCLEIIKTNIVTRLCVEKAPTDTNDRWLNVLRNAAPIFSFLSVISLGLFIGFLFGSCYRCPFSEVTRLSTLCLRGYPIPCAT